jgi:hypothetical protein
MMISFWLELVRNTIFALVSQSKLRKSEDNDVRSIDQTDDRINSSTNDWLA